VRAGGDLVTDISADKLQGVPRDDRVAIHFDGHTTHGIFALEHDQPEMTLLAFVGRDECLEITLVGESAAAFLGIRSGSQVEVRW
jgi:hypothetical protein